MKNTTWATWRMDIQSPTDCGIRKYLDFANIEFIVMVSSHWLVWSYDKKRYSLSEAFVGHFYQTNWKEHLLNVILCHSCILTPNIRFGNGCVMEAKSCEMFVIIIYYSHGMQWWSTSIEIKYKFKFWKQFWLILRKICINVEKRNSSVTDSAHLGDAKGLCKN